MENIVTVIGLSIILMLVLILEEIRDINDALHPTGTETGGSK